MPGSFVNVANRLDSYSVSNFEKKGIVGGDLNYFLQVIEALACKVGGSTIHPLYYKTYKIVLK